MSFKKFGKDDGMDDWAAKVGDLMDQMLNRSYVHFRDAGTWQPSCNVYETVEAFYVCMAVAGIEQDQIDVQCVGTCSRLVISGQRGMPTPSDAKSKPSVLVMEIDQGPFRREIELPEAVDIKQIEASYSKGFLWITLPRTERADR